MRHNVDFGYYKSGLGSIGDFVWLDKKKPSEQLRPNRLCHRIADYLEMVEAEKGDAAKQVQKVMNMKHVKVDGAIVGFPCKGTWSWSSAAKDMYAAEVLEMAANFAELQ